MDAVTPDDALATLFAANVDSVFGFLVARCGSRQLAEDVCADTFAEAARVFVDGRGAEVTRAWLLHAARLRLIDHWRRAERHRARVERLSQTLRPAVGPEPSSDEDARVVVALRSLSERQRSVLVLRYLDGYSVTEVASALDLSYRATESLLARARRSLLAAYERSAQ